MLKGAVGSLKGWGYLLYYATNFVFTGLAVAVAFHAGPLQHRRRGPGLYGGRRRRRGGPRPRVPALAHRHSAGHPRLHGGGRLLGLDSRHPAGQARQPHRHHHDHVQLHRREPGGLSHQLLVPPGGQDGGGEPRDHRRLHHERARGGARVLRRAARLQPAQLLGLPRHHRRRRGVVPAVAHQARLRDPRAWAPMPMPPSMPASSRTASSSSPWRSPARSPD